MGTRAETSQKSLTTQQVGWTDTIFGLLTQITELVDLRSLLWNIILNPSTFWRSYFTKFNMVKFNPAEDIPDLTGKVILVTGGWLTPPRIHILPVS